MEELNIKLVEKYKELKERKVVETQEWHSRNEADFRKYHLAVVELIEELKNEISQLQDVIDKRENSYSESQNLLLEERRKTKELSSEVERCHELLSEGLQPSTFENGYNEIVPSNSPCNSPQARDSVKRSARKRKQNSAIRDAEVQIEETDRSSRPSPRQVKKPDCCRTNPVMSGDGDNSEVCPLKCVYQTLLESLVGFEFSIDTEINQPRLSASHLSSGYTFNLTRLKKDHEDDGEWYYQVSSLGTLERVAHEWMREDIIFSLAMCPVFFERISGVIGGR